ncbi:Pre-mRNA-splicing factor sap61 [Cryptotrichosporon argae]
MDSIMETQRATHEEIERYEQALADVLMQAPTVQRNITRRDRKAAEILDRVGELRKNLVAMYEDAPGLRPRELALLSAPAAGADDLAEFYARFDRIKDFHKRNADISARQFLHEIDEMVRSDGLQEVYVDDQDEPIVIDPLDNVFTAEEAYGKHVDVYLAHSQYLNLRGATRLSYIGYLDMLKTGKVERTLDVREKSDPAYLQYVQTLYDYFLGFFERALPLVDIHATVKEQSDKFESEWAEGKVPGWESGKKQATAAATGEGIWCSYCQKTYSKQTVYDAHLNSEKHKKREKAGLSASDPSAAATPSTSTSGAGSSSAREKVKAPARLTYLVSALLTAEPIPGVLAASRAEVERRSALTAREREAEADEDEQPAAAAEAVRPRDEHDDEDDDKVYNPLKLPLGWDGKPIPYWLYKLHGLGVEFKCEICSDYVYMGRKAFDKHFQESRHAFGMRALGLPNTRHFHEITKIADALALAEKLKHEGRQEMSAMERAEEFEDADGNVYDKKTYEDLKRQGLL